MRTFLMSFILGFSLIGTAQAAEVQTLPPRGGTGEGQINIQVPAASIFQYTTVILCDSPNFEMRRFSSFYKNRMLYVDLRYETFGFARGASCTLYFVVDDLHEFDYETGTALHASPQSFHFVIQ